MCQSITYSTGEGLGHFQMGTKEVRQESSSHTMSYCLPSWSCVLALLEEDLAFRFGICQSLVSQIINTWTAVLYNHLPVNTNWWISREANQKLMPTGFQQKYPYTQAIFDATNSYPEVVWPWLPKHSMIQLQTPFYSKRFDCSGSIWWHNVCTLFWMFWTVHWFHMK